MESTRIWNSEGKCDMSKRREVVIESGIKSKRFGADELIDTASWAYMRELRTHNSTKKIYDIDPYAEVYQFRDNLYGIFLENIDGGGDMWAYLIVGPEKAMLIDTGYGIGDLKGLAEQLSGGKKLIVVNTHPHPDHALGNFQFEEIFCHKYAIPQTEEYRASGPSYDKLYNPDGSFRYVEFDKNDLVPMKDFKITGVEDGHIFNLGEDYDIELIFMGGHQVGHCALLDRKSKTLFPGDNILSMRVMVKPRTGLYKEYGTIRTLRDNMKRLVDRIDEFDGIFPGHFMVDVDSRVVCDMYEALDEIVKDPEHCDYKEISETAGEKKFKFVKGFGVICYQDDCVM